MFANCIIHKSVFEYIKINLELKFYGGEELDFSYKLNKCFPNKIYSCKSAYVIRLGFPIYKKHCDRLMEFGATNLKILGLPLKKEVVKNLFFLNKTDSIKFII